MNSKLILTARGLAARLSDTMQDLRWEPMSLSQVASTVHTSYDTILLLIRALEEADREYSELKKKNTSLGTTIKELAKDYSAALDQLEIMQKSSEEWKQNCLFYNEKYSEAVATLQNKQAQNDTTLPIYSDEALADTGL